MAKLKNKIIIRWKDLKGRECSKIYNTLDEAERAKKWLNSNNIADVELAVIQEEIKEENDETEI